MNTVMFITSSEVKTMVPEINNEVESGVIDNAIKLCQQSVLKPTCGQEWFDQLLTERANGVYSIPNNYIMTNYLKWILAYSVWQYLVISLSLQMNSAGLRIKVSEHSEAAQTKDIQYYREFIQNWIDSQRKSMYRYINLNQNDYPLYFNNKYHEHPKNNQYNFKIGGVGGIGGHSQTHYERY